jgi:RNA polymerase sigma-70 factor (ECF subfamily)
MIRKHNTSYLICIVKKLFAICIRYLKDEEEALDALNRSFMKIFDKIHSFKGNTKLETWMKRITINPCLNKIKSNKSYKHTFIQTDEFIFYDEPDESQNESDDYNWWEKALALLSEVFFNLIENLPPATRTVFNLYTVDGFTHLQISEHLSISTGTSKWHLNKARSILKEKNHSTHTKQKL